jgi:predicted RecB family nuclease
MLHRERIHPPSPEERVVHVRNGCFRLSATDLSRYLACQHLTELDRSVAEGRRSASAWSDPRRAILLERGLQHESAYVRALRESGKRVVELGPEAGSEAVAEAMRSRADVITQAVLHEEIWGGRADLLLRVEEESALGAWSYEVADTKLAHETRGGTVLQLCVYSALLEGLIERKPTRMHVVRPGPGFPIDSFRVADYEAYFRSIQKRLAEHLAHGPSETYPNKVSHCDVCEWWQACDAQRRRDDHLSLVAGMLPHQIEHVKRHGSPTLAQFAERPFEDFPRPRTGSREALEKSWEQARIQLRGRREGAPAHELLPLEPGRGLFRLPEPSPGDLFFDFEGDPFVDGGGLEYLFGFAMTEDAAEGTTTCESSSATARERTSPAREDVAGGSSPRWAYRGLWALTRAEEKRALEQFLDFAIARWEKHAGMHIYHYTPYERAALERLVGRHATRAAELDRLLRGERLVDLHAVTRQTLRASVEKYSLKDLEPFFEFRRRMDLGDASRALRRVESILELGSDLRDEEEALETVRSYNEEDCLATAALRDWLERIRSEQIDRGNEIPRPELLTGDPSQKSNAKEQETAAVFAALIDGIPEESNERSDEEAATWLLAHLLDYFSREEKCAWWEYFRVREMEHEDLLLERSALAGLVFEENEGGTAACPVQRYRFPPQETGITKEDELHEVGGDAIGTVVRIDPVRGSISIKRRTGCAGRRPAAVHLKSVVFSSPLDKSLLELGRWVAENGIGTEGPWSAARELLLRRPPRFGVVVRDGGRGNESSPDLARRKLHLDGGDLPAVSKCSSNLRADDEPAQDAAVRLARALNGGVLAIQGPPGTGKTVTGARMIAELAASGASVGVTAVSHQVIRNLLTKTRNHWAETRADAPPRIVHKNKPADGDPDWLEVTASNEVAVAAAAVGAITGGTAWLWAREDAESVLDYLFIDEAGQMSLAHVLAASRAARNLVLLGDPRQLQQPQRGAHPEGAEVSALSHLLGGRDTIPPHLGLFLETTWRLAPSICSFTSELYYENRLAAHPTVTRQAVLISGDLAGTGPIFVPVEHQANQSRSDEEVNVVRHLLDRLVESGSRWIDARGETRPLGLGDILVVAPYNAQVAALIAALPSGARVGTVDKFQGQEAAVVIYSMTSSSASDAPRGMDFLFDPHRLNVATSRARCLCILVASPAVFRPDCKTPKQMRFANGLCRFLELARKVQA